MDSAAGATARRVDIPAPRPPGESGATQAEVVVVGVDGSASSVAALVWAMRHALEERCGLLVLTAWPLGRRTFVHEVPGHFNEARWEAREAQARSIAYARSVVDSVPAIETALANAPAVEALLAAAATGKAVVLGTDRAADAAVPSGAATSLTVLVQQDAACPVILVPVARSAAGPSRHDEPGHP